MYRWADNSEFWGLGAAAPSAAVQSALQNAANRYGVPVSLLTSVAQTESSFNPSAVSPKGATGLMQIMPANYSSLGVTNPTDPQQSADAGAKLLSQYYAQYGDWNTALIAYNEGPGNLANQGVFPSSQSYADTVLSNAGLYTPTPVPANDPGASQSAGIFDTGSGFDLSTFDGAVSSAGVSPWLVGGIAAGAALLVWALS